MCEAERLLCEQGASNVGAEEAAHRMRRAAGALAAAEAILRDELADVSGALDAALKVRLLYIYMYKYTYIHTYIHRSA